MKVFSSFIFAAKPIGIYVHIQLKIFQLEKIEEEDEIRNSQSLNSHWKEHGKTRTYNEWCVFVLDK